MKKVFNHIRFYVFRGFLAFIPIGIAIFTVRLVYIFIDSKVMELIDPFKGYRIPGVGLNEAEQA
jgi:hypothetical protein